MASEELKDVQELIKLSRSPHDSGPFYHHSFWEAYKGSLKGKLGGAFIGITVGLLAGVVAGGLAAFLIPAATLATAGLTASSVFLSITGGITAAGMFYGAKEFGDSGRTAGAVAAAHKDGERRLMAFEKARFAELKQEIGEIKSMLGNKPQSASATQKNDIDIEKVEGELEKYRRTHFSDNFPHPKKLVSWKVVIAGLAIGALAGWGFGLFGATAGVLNFLNITIPEGAATIATAIGLGSVGASFGINRDLFRKIFDATDNWFKGIYNYGKKMGTELAPPAEAIDITNDKRRPTTPKVSTVIYPDLDAESHKSDTFYRDRVVANAKQVLIDMDHTNTRAH